MDLSIARTNEEAWQIVDARRFLPSPPLRRPAPTAGEPSVDADDGATTQGTEPAVAASFVRDPACLAAVRPPEPTRALQLANLAARAFVDGRRPGPPAPFDALQTVCLRNTTALSLTGARAAWYQQPAFHRRIGALLVELDQVTSLGLAHLELSGPAALAVVPRQGERLRRLDLSCNPLRDGATSLLGGGHWRHLEVLDLASTGLDDHFLRELPAERLPALRVLQLQGNTFSAEGLDAARLEVLPALRGLGLASCGLFDEGGLLVRALSRLRLDVLVLRDNPVVERARTLVGLDRLARTVHF